MYILDTDLLTLAFQGRGDDATQLKKRLAQVSRNEVATTIVNYEEQMRGWLSFAAKAKDVSGLVDAYRKLEKYLEDFKHIPLLSFSEAAAVEFQRLRKSVRIGTMDLRIAAVALTLDATVLLRNLKDFEKVPGLKVEDWSA